jgi:RimJ/RimL family protein N-acetyltransferase
VTEALHRIRLRTSRLELRLGSADELLELARLAERGIHPPDEMPFSIAWSDAIGTPGFVDGFLDFHRQALAGWSPERWSLHLLVWADRRLVGTQGLVGDRFAADRRVATGSWLGREHQRQGIGTDMRAAVLELAFAGLGAQSAASAWLDGNEGSRRVSARLGYSEIGTHTESPRGTPVVAHDVELLRADWRCPVAVEIAGLEDCLPLFGS